MLLISILSLIVLTAPGAGENPRGAFDSVVPRLPGGYSAGRVSLRVHTVPMPEAVPEEFVGDLVARTGASITETHGVRIEVVLPDDVTFESIEARVVDGLVLRPEGRSFIGRVGSALVSLLRILFIGKLVAATDDLVLPGALWATALGAPDEQEEFIRLSTSDALAVNRDANTFSDHGSFVVCRAMLALSPWTELLDIRLECFDRTTGKRVGFVIPRVPLYDEEFPKVNRNGNSRLAAATSR